MQHEITERGALLDARGSLREPGWAKSLLLDYRRAEIRASKWRIKEWDYYLIYNNECGVALTVADNGYMSLLSASLLDFVHPGEKTTSLMGWFPFGKLGLPSDSSAGVTAGQHGSSRLAFDVQDGVRKLSCYMEGFDGKKTLTVDLGLFDPPRDTMVIATPYADDPKAFYYNQKIIGMRAEGYAQCGDRKLVFDRADSYGLLDWGRGVWTYKNTWYWGGAQGAVDGVRFGFNIGYGFGDTAAASENMLFYDGVCHKLDRLTFNIPQKDGKDDYLSPWTFTSNDGRFEMDFLPILDRASKTDVGVICSDQHQIFGRYTGSAVLDDGRVIRVRDFLGFAEKVYNKW